MRATMQQMAQRLISVIYQTTNDWTNHHISPVASQPSKNPLKQSGGRTWKYDGEADRATQAATCRRGV